MNKKTTDDQLEIMLGYRPGAELRKRIIDETRSNGADIREIVAKYHLPELAILGADGKFSSDFGRITPAEWYEKNPLGKYGNLVIIKAREKKEPIK